MTRKETDGLTAEIQGVGAGGLPMCKVAEEGGRLVLQTGIAKFFPADTVVNWCRPSGPGLVI